MKIWIARGVGKDGRLTLHYERPTYKAGKGWDKLWAIPDSSLFPEVTFENSPQEVELKLVKK
jgi:hypothetical protein